MKKILAIALLVGGTAQAKERVTEKDFHTKTTSTTKKLDRIKKDAQRAMQRSETPEAGALVAAAASDMQSTVATAKNHVNSFNELEIDQDVIMCFMGDKAFVDALKKAAKACYNASLKALDTCVPELAERTQYQTMLSEAYQATNSMLNMAGAASAFHKPKKTSTKKS